MSRPDTGRLTAAALSGAGHPPTFAVTLRDVDLPEDASAVAAEAPTTRFAATWRGPRREPTRRVHGGPPAGVGVVSERTLRGVAARIDERIPRPESFSSGLRGPRTAARIGMWLGITFTLAFATGLYSHASQLATPPVALPTGPTRLYQVTQALHVAAGTASIPLLLVKLWSVFPRLFVRPPRRARELVLHLLERGSIALLVGAAIFQLVTGLANSAQWYPWSFGFVGAHYALAWVAIGALGVHVAVKLPVIRRAFLDPVDDAPTAARASTAAPAAAPSCTPPGCRQRSPSSRPRPRRCRGCGGWPSSPCAPGRGRRASRSTAAPSPPGSPTSSPTRPGASGSSGRRRPSSSRSTTCAPWPSTRPCCRSRASRDGAPVASGAACRVRDVVALAGGGPTDDVVLRSMQTRGALPGEPAAGQLRAARRQPPRADPRR